MLAGSKETVLKGAPGGAARRSKLTVPPRALALPRKLALPNGLVAKVVPVVVAVPPSRAAEQAQKGRARGGQSS